MNLQASDQQFMSMAIQVAKKGRYTSRPNPYVGCVIVKNNQVIGEGYTQEAGDAHAEVHALQNTQQSVKNATAFVTLEPCSHTGKTPPCADAMINSGIKRVVIAMLDPNPLVAGQGMKMLIDANIDVSVGVLEDQARQLNAGFFKRMEHGLPFVRLKMAMSLDGKTAMASGESQWITADKARHDVQRLRAQSGAILTGSGTVIDDNPSLNVRLNGSDLNLDHSNVPEIPQPLRVVLDTHLKVSESSKIFGLKGSTVIYTCSDDGVKTTALENAGAKVQTVSADLESKKVDLKSVLQDLAVTHQINDIHVEAGASLSGALIAAQLVDEILIYMAPTILGGNARSLFNMPALAEMKDKLNVEIKDIRAIGNDWRITAIPVYS